MNAAEKLPKAEVVRLVEAYRKASRSLRSLRRAVMSASAFLILAAFWIPTLSLAVGLLVSQRRDQL